jgi:hypothetical protein
MYRHDMGRPVERAEVAAIQPLDEVTDPMLWIEQLDASGMPLLHEGRPVRRARVDPWPWLMLRTLRPYAVQTREARLRDAPGWLPLDWEMRYRPYPTPDGRLIMVRPRALLLGG